MKKQCLGVVAAVCVLMWASVPIAARQGRGHGRGNQPSERAEEHRARPEKHQGGASRAVGTRGVAKGRKAAPPIAERAVVIDRDGHRRVVTEYFSRASLPPGLAKRQSLPPGLQKQLRERGHLPPGLQKRLVPVPGPLVSQLPVVPVYYSRYFAGRDLIVVDRRTNVIVAVIPDVVIVR
jgi:hypothetical protein